MYGEPANWRRALGAADFTFIDRTDQSNSSGMSKLVIDSGRPGLANLPGELAGRARSAG
jgi:hypothetical protein